MSLRENAERISACRGSIEKGVKLGGVVKETQKQRAEKKKEGAPCTRPSSKHQFPCIIECSRRANPAFLSPTLQLERTWNGLSVDARLSKVFCEHESGQLSPSGNKLFFSFLRRLLLQRFLCELASAALTINNSLDVCAADCRTLVLFCSCAARQRLSIEIFCSPE